VNIEYYSDAECVKRDVRRVPLKRNGLTDDEVAHLALSSDGLRFFHPVQLHRYNCQSTDGLLAVLAELIQTYNIKTSRRYSILNVDVSLYNSLLHMVYACKGMELLRSRVFCMFGIWHVYLYGHVAIWDAFRATFLADAFFSLFPNTTLMRRPSLFKSSVFFTWLRLSYPRFRAELLFTLQNLKEEYLELDHNPRRNKKLHAEAKARFIHCCNLYTLFEFAIPVLQDYGLAIKLCSLELFLKCFQRILKLFILLRSQGSNMYTRSMLIFWCHLNYWKKHKVSSRRA
jgi:hypothetical protein